MALIISPIIRNIGVSVLYCARPQNWGGILIKDNIIVAMGISNIKRVIAKIKRVFFMGFSSAINDDLNNSEIFSIVALFYPALYYAPAMRQRNCPTQAIGHTQKIYNPGLLKTITQPKSQSS
jgi:hypothetical protein